MSRVLTCGFETGDINEAGITGGSGTFSVVTSSPAPRVAGTYCLKFLAPAGIWNAGTNFALPAPVTELWVRLAMYVSFPGGQRFNFLQLNDSAGNVQASVSYDTSDGLLRYSTATASTSFPQGSWHVIEFRHQILTATTGAAEVWLDGNQVITFSGDTSASATLNVQAVLVGQFTNFSMGASYVAFDDIAVNTTAGTLNNARPGDGRVIMLAPNGAGSSTQFTRGGTDTGANWSQTSEIPPSIAQYVGSATVGQRDLYTLSDIGIAVSSINVVEEVLLAQNSDAGGGYIAPTIKSGATVNEATAIGLTTSAGYVRARWETDPNTSAAWTIAAVNALEAGATVR